MPGGRAKGGRERGLRNSFCSPAPVQSGIEHFPGIWDYRDPSASESRFRSLLAQGGSLDFRLQVMSQIGRALCLQRRFDEAAAVLADAAAALRGGESTAAARVVLERGRVHRDQGEIVQATACFRRALELAGQAAEPYLTVDALHMLGHVQTGDEALQTFRGALDLARGSDDPMTRRWQCTLHDNLSAALCRRGDFAGALACAEEMEKAAPDDSRKRDARWRRGRALRRMGRIPEAQALQETLLLEAPGDGWILGELGECHWDAGRTAEASAAFEKSLDALRNNPWALAGEPDWLRSMRARCGDGNGGI